MDSLRRIVQALRQSSAHSEQSTHLTGAQALVLKHIAAREGLSVNDLAGLTFTHQSTVSEVVSRLETAGLVRRTRAPEDGRRWQLHLTEAGKTIAQKATETAQEKLMRGLQGLPPQTVAQLSIGLDALIAAAGLADQPPLMFFEPTANRKGPSA